MNSNSKNIIIFITICIFFLYIYNSKKKETFYTGDNENTSKYFDLDYINRRKCIIAITNSSNNTYQGTKSQSLGTVMQNNNSSTAYQPTKENTINNLYDTVFVYIGNNDGVGPNSVYNSKQNSVQFLTAWEIIKYTCNGNDLFLIRNVETNRFLGCGKLTDNSDNKTKNLAEKIIYLSNEKALTEHNLWIIESIGKNNYYIKSKSCNKYLYGLNTKNTQFVTNAYNSPFCPESQFKKKPLYNDYTEVSIRTQPFSWFIVPLPPYNGVWKSTSSFLCGYTGNPQNMIPCKPNSNSNKVLPYSWYQKNNNEKCYYPIPIEFIYLKKSLKAVYELGTVGISPWGDCPGFRNQQAKWIWYTPNAQNSAISNQGASFVYVYDCKQIKVVTINCIVDNTCEINLFSGYNSRTRKMNKYNIGTQTGGWNGSGGLYDVKLEAGPNYFIFNAMTQNTKAGLLVSVFNTDDDKILFSTGDTGWGFTSIYNK